MALTAISRSTVSSILVRELFVYTLDHLYHLLTHRYHPRYVDGNLYVGTSAAELLHFVSIPPDPSDPSGRPVFIPASRLSPAFAENTTSRPGVQQILLLPRVGKACILCNGTVTFYSLPELSPVFGTKQVKNCGWIGGVDLNEEGLGDGATNTGETVTALLSLNRRIQVVRIDEDVRAVKV